MKSCSWFYWFTMIAGWEVLFSHCWWSIRPSSTFLAWSMRPWVDGIFTFQFLIGQWGFQRFQTIACRVCNKTVEEVHDLLVSDFFQQSWTTRGGDHRNIVRSIGRRPRNRGPYPSRHHHGLAPNVRRVGPLNLGRDHHEGDFRWRYESLACGLKWVI